MEDRYPFFVHDNDAFTISLDVDDAFVEKYEALFQRHGYYLNGGCVKDHVKQILAQLDPELRAQMVFDGESDGMFAYARDKAGQQRFVAVMRPVFADLAVLERYVSMADRSKIYD
jgi:hypothetical protein